MAGGPRSLTPTTKGLLRDMVCGVTKKEELTLWAKSLMGLLGIFQVGDGARSRIKRPLAHLDNE